MKYFITSVLAMQQADTKTLKEKKLTRQALIKQVGQRLFEAFINHEKSLNIKKVIVVAGTGYNGADALVMAKHLIAHGYNTRVYMPKKTGLKEETKGFKEALNHAVFIEDFTKDQDATHIIDGLVGTGLNQRLSPTLSFVVDKMNELNAKIVSIDIPSGLSGDSGVALGACVKADLTLVVEMLKYGNVLHQAFDYSQTFKVVSCDIMVTHEALFYAKDESLYKDTNRLRFSHKYDYGKLAVIGGSKHMMGAPYLAALAALKSGCGHVSVWHKEREIAFAPTQFIELLKNSYSSLEDWDESTTCVFGMGLGKDDASDALNLDAVLKREGPLVIDADGLSYIKDKLSVLHENVVLTPHTGEFSELLEINTQALLQDTMAYVNAFVKKTSATLVLKGPVSIVANRDKVVLIESGNPCLAKAGSGDVLAGIIGRFLARGCKAFDASTQAVYVHGKAGDLAREQYGCEALCATDVIACLGKVFD